MFIYKFSASGVTKTALGSNVLGDFDLSGGRIISRFPNELDL